MVSKAESWAVCRLMESVLDGTHTAREASELLEINLQVIERVAGRMLEQRLGLPPTPPDGDDDNIEWGARRFYRTVMRRKW